MLLEQWLQVACDDLGHHFLCSALYDCRSTYDDVLLRSSKLLCSWSVSVELSANSAIQRPTVSSFHHLLSSLNGLWEPTLSLHAHDCFTVWLGRPQLKQVHTRTSEVNIIDSLVQGLGRPYRDTKIGLLVAHGSSFGQIPFLPLPIT